MADMSLTKYPIPEQDPDIRNKNFAEVSLGYTEALAKKEAARCLQCKHKPCIAGCPVQVDIPGFILKIAQGDHEGAYAILKDTNTLPAVCGRVCPQETQCEEKCVRAIKGESVGIGRLERFAADRHMEKVCEAPIPPVRNGKKVAVVGSGPAGLTCAGDLAMLGYEVTVFEAFHVPGGVLMYGIPEFRLPKSIVQKEIDDLRKIGVSILTNRVIGRAETVDELLDEEGFSAVFIGTGAGLPSFMNIPGENLNSVYTANEFLTRINLMKAYKWPECDTPVRIGKRVAVIGGGNVAMDAARSAKRLGAEQVCIVYRRSEQEMPARLEEVHHAKEEGIQLVTLTNPTAILDDGKGWVRGMTVVDMELGEVDAKGRRSTHTIEGSEHELPFETVVIAIGQSPNPLIRQTTPGLSTQRWGGIIVDESTGESSKPRVYAGGDAVTGAATVILAMGAGKIAAKAIDEMIRAKQD
jgi:glutamate synthase (NADPH/NADH) small chain